MKLLSPQLVLGSGPGPWVSILVRHFPPGMGSTRGPSAPLFPPPRMLLHSLAEGWSSPYKLSSVSSFLRGPNPEALTPYMFLSPIFPPIVQFSRSWVFLQPLILIFIYCQEYIKPVFPLLTFCHRSIRYMVCMLTISLCPQPRFCLGTAHGHIGHWLKLLAVMSLSQGMQHPMCTCHLSQWGRLTETYGHGNKN